MFSGKRTKYLYFNDFTSAVLISNVTLLTLLFAIKELARFNTFRYEV